MTEEVKKRVKIVDGPALFKGIICDRWIFAPMACRQRVPLFFTAEGGKKLHTTIYGFLPVHFTNSAHNEMVVLLGQTADRDICPTEHFAMFYDSVKKSGELEPIEPFTCASSLVHEYCEGLFKAPRAEETPLNDYLLALPREQKIHMAEGFLDDLFEQDAEARITKPVWIRLLHLSRDLSEQIRIEVQLGDNKLGRKIFWRLDDVCKKLNQFMRDFGLTDFVGCGIALGGIGNLYNSLDGVCGRGGFTRHEIPLNEILRDLPDETKAPTVESAPAAIDREKLISMLSREQKMQVLVNQVLLMIQDGVMPDKLGKLLLAHLEGSELLKKKFCLYCPNELLTEAPIRQRQVLIATLNQTLDKLGLDEGLASTTDETHTYLYNFAGEWTPQRQKECDLNRVYNQAFFTNFKTSFRLDE